MTSKLPIEAQFQRDLNRCTDSDRTTRKKGLEKLLESLPWEKKSTRKELLKFLFAHVLKVIMNTISDPIEKCREYSLKILKQTATIWKYYDEISSEFLLDLTVKLCTRVGDIPFPETAEELRLLVLEMLYETVKLEKRLLTKGSKVTDKDEKEETLADPAVEESTNPEANSTLVQTESLAITEEPTAVSAISLNSKIVERIMNILSKALQDSFPAAKKQSSDILNYLCIHFPMQLRVSQQTTIKHCLKSLVGNALHQHSKIRSVTLQAIGHCLLCSTYVHYQEYMQTIPDTQGNGVGGGLAGSMSSMASTTPAANTTTNALNLLALFQRILLTDRIPSVKTTLVTVIYQLLSYRFRTIFESATTADEIKASLLSIDYSLLSLTLLLTHPENPLYAPEVAAITEQQLESMIRTVGWYEFFHNTKKHSNKSVRRSSTEEEEDASMIIDGEEALARQQQETKGSSSGMEIEEDTNELEIPLHHSATEEGSSSAVGEVEEDTSLSISKEKLFHAFFTAYQHELITLLLNGMDSWTVDQRLYYIYGVSHFITYIQQSLQPYLSVVLHALILHAKDIIQYQEVEIRQGLMKAGQMIGKYVAIEEIQAILLPRVMGELPAYDAIGYRTGALRVLMNIWQGIPLSKDLKQSPTTYQRVLNTILFAMISSNNTLQIRDVVYREAVLLFVRVVTDSLVVIFPVTTTNDIEEQAAATAVLQESIVRKLTLILLYLIGKCPQEEDSVADNALKELYKLATRYTPSTTPSTTTSMSHNDTEKSDPTIVSFLSKHYLYCLYHILLSSNPAIIPAQPLVNIEDIPSSALSTIFVTLYPVLVNPKIVWDTSSPMKAAFHSLIYHCYAASWENASYILPIISGQIQPPGEVAPNSMEANLHSYASQRGEEILPTTITEYTHHTRMSLLLLLEHLLQEGIVHWECSSFILEHAIVLVKEMLLPNLIWRIGRVEATIRKITLTICYHLLKAGCLSSPKILGQVASELIPLFINHLDDTESTPRLMACYGLSILFERLPHQFPAMFLSDVYHKLISRLDDNHDEIRLAMCKTLQWFFLCGGKAEYYHNTMVEYMVEQLFIHIDDMNTAIQQACYEVLLVAGKEIPAAKTQIVHKAAINRHAHRTAYYCDQLITHLQGIQILEEEDA